MWIWMALASALLLGAYDVAKKAALRHNDVYIVLLGATALSVLFLSPFLSHGSAGDHLRLAFKAVLVTSSWVSGMYALKLLPITIVSTYKASRPMFVVVLSMLIFGERLNLWQLAGVLSVLAALYLLAQSGRKEGIHIRSDKGMWALALSIATGVASALYDKYLMTGMQPLFVQSWTNVYITLLLFICVFVRGLRNGNGPMRADWRILLIAVFITGADMLYFFALKQDGAMLSVISLVRRCSVVVTFVLGAMLFREKNLRARAGALAVMLAGMAFLTIGSI